MDVEVKWIDLKTPIMENIVLQFSNFDIAGKSANLQIDSHAFNMKLQTPDHFLVFYHAP